MKTNPYFFRTALVFLAMLYLAGCSGDNTQLAGGAGGTGISHGVMTKGSVIVNGVRYDDTNANISIDDTPKTALNLHDGMVVSVRGNASGSAGTATEVRGQIEVRGLVTAKDPAASPQHFTVFNQKVFVDDWTVYSHITFTGITAGATIVEVHGQRDATGNIHASRVEGSLAALGDGTGMTNPLVDEIRGVVSGAVGSNPTTFNLGTQAVALTPSATITGGSFTNGSIVEVHCTLRPDCLDAGGVFQASLVEVEDNVNLPGVGERFETEGLVSGFSINNPNNFFVNGTPVKITATTTFRGGIKSDLLNNIKVEAEGTWNGTTLTARKIEFKRTVVRLQGEITAATAPTFTLHINGVGDVTVETDSFTNGTVQALNTCVQIRGQRKAGNTLIVTAGEIITTGCSGDHLIQAPVEVELSTNLTLLGFAIDIASANDATPYRDFNGTSLTQAQFLAAVTPASDGPPATAGTLVKIRFNTPGGTVKQVELED